MELLSSGEQLCYRAAGICGWHGCYMQSVAIVPPMKGLINCRPLRAAYLLIRSGFDGGKDLLYKGLYVL